MLTRRKIRQVRGEAERWYSNGIYWNTGDVAAPPAGPFRIAFNAGRATAASTFPSRGMSTETWTQVLAEWLSSR